MAQLTIAQNEEQLAHAAAEQLTQLIEAAVNERGVAFVSMTGGTTPQRLYETLADPARDWRSRIPWSAVHLFWGDERHVPPDHADSNFGMAKTALLDHVPIPADHVHRMRGELPPAEAAADYERTIDRVVSAFRRTDMVSGSSRTTDWTFDVMLLGLGEDAHIASIFQGSELLRDVAAEHPASGAPRVVAIWAPHLNAWRITLTPAAILDSERIVMLVAGKQKAAAVHAAIAAPLDVAHVPVQLLRSAGDRVEWLLDRAAASSLS